MSPCRRPGRISTQHALSTADSRESHLAFAWRPPSTPRLREYLERSGVTLAEGQKAEINLDAIDWLRKVAGILKEGFLVTIDYGDVAGHLYGTDRFGGTLRSFYRHALIDSVLERVGEQDITASVNFTALIEYGIDCGFETISYERQADFLMRNGLIDRLAGMEQAGRSALNNLKGRIAIKNLFVPGGVSDNFRVLIQRKVNEGSRAAGKAVGRRQEAGGRRQEAGGRRQEAGGSRQEAGRRRQEAGRQDADRGVIILFYCFRLLYCYASCLLLLPPAYCLLLPPPASRLLLPASCLPPKRLL